MKTMKRPEFEVEEEYELEEEDEDMRTKKMTKIGMKTTMMDEE
jgi:hypothetical protein